MSLLVRLAHKDSDVLKFTFSLVSYADMGRGYDQMMMMMMMMMMKSRTIKFRCSESEKERIEGMSREAGTTISEYCRQQSLSGRILANRRLSPDEIAYFKALKEHNNALARMANLIRNKLPGLAEAIAEYLERSRELYNRFF